LLQKDCFAIVGARNASAAGMNLAQRIAEEVGQAGYVITSGMARGIDGVVHKAALATGTIAVLAGGVDVIYPQQHRDLYAQLCEMGLVVSEMPLGTQPQARHFPRRNRIISGLSLGTLVTEATYKSGSLITARQALEQGREVFAIPGSPLDPRAKGPNELIRQGAVLTESASDILQALNNMRQRRISDTQLNLFEEAPVKETEGPEMDKIRHKIHDLLSHAPIDIDELIRQTDFDVSDVLAALLELELAGNVIRTSGNRVALA